MMPEPSESRALRFCYSEELHTKTTALLDAIEHAADATQHSKALGDVVVQLTSSGLHYYFLKPLALANAGFFSQQSAQFGVSSAVNIMSPLIRTAIGLLDKDQLVVISGFIRSLMV
jgi:hypothetical protein